MYLFTGDWIHLVDFLLFITRETTFVTSGLLVLPYAPSPFEKGSTLKEKILKRSLL